MFNDESNRSSSQSQGQGGFVRRPIPNNPKYSGGEKSGSYQQGQGSYGSGYNSGGYNNGERQHSSGQSYSGGERQYNSSQRGRRPEGGGSGGYRQGGSGYGYNRNNNYGGNNDRLIRQNDIIIKLLKDIRDRLPAPPGMTDSDSYSSDSSYSSSSYSSGSSYRQEDSGDEADFDVSGGEQEEARAADGDDAEQEDNYNS